MISAFVGTDNYESYRGAKKKLDEYASEIEILDGDEVTITDVLEKTQSVGLFSDASTVFLKRPFSNKILSEGILEHFKTLSKSDVVIWEDHAPKKNMKLPKKLIKEKVWHEFIAPKPWKIEPWVRTICKAKKVELSKKQVDRLIELTEGEKFLLANELQKIVHFCKARDISSIDDSLFNQILGLEAQGDIWKFLDEFGSKNYANARQELQKLLKYNDLSQYVIAMITRELQLILDVIIAEETKTPYKELGLHPYVLQKTKKKADKFTKEELVSFIDNLAMLDFRIKKGDIDSTNGLTLYLQSIHGKHYFLQ